MLDLDLRFDLAIAQLAQRETLVVVTKDSDFLALQQLDRFAVLRLAYGNCSNEALLDRLDKQLPVAERLLQAGELLVELR